MRHRRQSRPLPIGSTKRARVSRGGFSGNYARDATTDFDKFTRAIVKLGFVPSNARWGGTRQENGWSPYAAIPGRLSLLDLDLDGPWHAGSLLVDFDFQDTVLALGGQPIGIDIARQIDLPAEPAETTLVS